MLDLTRLSVRKILFILSAEGYTLGHPGDMGAQHAIMRVR